MKKYLVRVVFALLIAVASTSCSSEYRTLNRMEKLTTKVERDGYRYTADDWRDVLDDYKDIAQDSKKCNFTSANSERMGEMQGRAMATFAKWTADKATGIYKQGKGILSGLLEGLGLGTKY